MANEMSKSAKWAKRLAVVTLVCAGLIIASLIFAFSAPSSEGGLAMLCVVVGPTVLICGPLGLLASIAGASLGARACIKAKRRGPVTLVATVFHVLVVVGVAAYVIARMTVWSPRAQSGENDLAYAVMTGDTKTVQLELERGADPNQSLRAWGEPLIIVAAGSLHKDIAGLLLDHGANPNARRVRARAGETPLHIVLDPGGPQNWHEVDIARPAIVQMLLEHGADVNAKDGVGRTCTYVAAEREDESLLRVMMRYGADVNVPCGGGTPLAHAARDGHAPWALTLIRLGANVNCLIPNVGTAVFAVEDPNMLDLLCTHGADVNLGRDYSGYSALARQVSLQFARPQMVKSLIAHGADVNFKTTKGESVLDLAKKRKDPDIIRMIEEAIATSKAGAAAAK